MNKRIKKAIVFAIILISSLCIFSGCSEKKSESVEYTRCTGNTMESTYTEGQLLKVESAKNIEKLERGDVVVIEAPSVPYINVKDANYNNPIAVYDDKQNSEVQLLKRIIGVVGDNIKIENNKVFLNGELLKEVYLNYETNTTSLDGAFIDITVPEDCIYVLGDNREVSNDSRRFGCIPIEKVVYRVIE